MMKKKKCPHCKFLNAAKKSFCDACGRPIQSEPEFIHDNVNIVHSKKRQADYDGHF